MLFSRGTRVDLGDRFFHRYDRSSLTRRGKGVATCSLPRRGKNPTKARLAQDNPTCCQEDHSIRAKISESVSSNRSLEPHPTIVTVRRTLRYGHRQTLYLIRTHDSGKGEEERESGVIRSVLQRNTTITGGLLFPLFSRERRTEPSRFKAKRSAEP